MKPAITPHTRAHAQPFCPCFTLESHMTSLGAPSPHTHVFKCNFLALIILVVFAESKQTIRAEQRLLYEIQECINTAYDINVSNKIPPLAITGPPSCMPGVGIRHQHGRPSGSMTRFLKDAAGAFVFARSKSVKFVFCLYGNRNALFHTAFQLRCCVEKYSFNP